MSPRVCCIGARIVGASVGLGSWGMLYWDCLSRTTGAGMSVGWGWGAGGSPGLPWHDGQLRHRLKGSWRLSCKSCLVGITGTREGMGWGILGHATLVPPWQDVWISHRLAESEGGMCYAGLHWRKCWS